MPCLPPRWAICCPRSGRLPGWSWSSGRWKADGGGAQGLAWLAPLGRASAAIYVAHVPFSAALRILLAKCGVVSVPLHMGLGTAIGVIGPLALVAVLGRFGWTGLFGLPAPAPKSPRS